MRGSSYGEREDSETQSYDANEFSGPIRAVCLTTSGMADPVAVDDERPSFGWHVAGEGAVGQRAYHVHVASSRRDLLETSNLIWDSGRVEADSSNGIRFDGSELRPGTRYWWTVRVWIWRTGRRNGRSLPRSERAEFQWHVEYELDCRTAGAAPGQRDGAGVLLRPQV